MTVHDDTTVTVRSRRPQRFVDTWSTYYPRHLLEDPNRTNWVDWPYWLAPVGNGPYRYLRHIPQTMVELEANPDYFKGRPVIDRVVLRFGNCHLTELLGGAVDAMHYVEHGVVPRLRADPRFEVYHHMWPDAGWTDVIFWNHRDPILSDARARRAFTHAIDRAELRAFFELPADLPIVDVLYSGPQISRRELPPPIPYDPEAARRRPHGSGSDGDERRPYTMSLLSAVATGDPDRPRARMPRRAPTAGPPPDGGCPYSPRCPESTDYCRAIEPALASKLPGRLASCHQR